MGKKFNVVSICLLLMLGFRLMVHAEPALASQHIGSLIVFFLYLIPFVGVILRKRWGPVVSGVVGILDLAMSLFYIQGVGLLGVVITDVALVFLSCMDYRQVTMKKGPSLGNPSEPVHAEVLSRTE